MICKALWLMILWTQAHTSQTLSILLMKQELERFTSVFPKLSLINKNQGTSKLLGKENEESQKCGNATSSYNQVYADAILSRQLQNEESNSLEQRADVPIKKRELIQNRKASFNSHYGLNTHEHEQLMQINPNGYDHDTTNRQKHWKCYQMTPPWILQLGTDTPPS